MLPTEYVPKGTLLGSWGTAPPNTVPSEGGFLHPRKALVCEALGLTTPGSVPEAELVKGDWHEPAVAGQDPTVAPPLTPWL